MTVETLVSGTSWVAPAGVTSVQVQAWGGGAAGGGNSTAADGGGGGGGGAYAVVQDTVVPTTSYSYSLGAAGTGSAGADGANGGDTTWRTNVVIAKGGVGGKAPVGGAGGVAGSGGLASGSTGTTKFDGGWGNTGRDNATGQGGGGATSAGTGADGANDGSAGAFSTTAPTGPAGSSPGGAGGGANNAGSVPASGNGGGGGGSGDTSGGALAGGAGTIGKIVLTYFTNTSLTATGSALTLTPGAATTIISLAATGAALALTGGAAEPTFTRQYVDTVTRLSPQGTPSKPYGTFTKFVSENFTLDGTGGALVLTGGEATFTLTLPASGSALALTGGEADLSYTDDVSLDATGSALALTGGDADLSYTANIWLDGEGSQLTFTGGDAELVAQVDYVLDGEGTALVLSGGTASFDVTVPQEAQEQQGRSRKLLLVTEYTVTIDGQEFRTETIEQAQALLDKAVVLAPKAIKRATHIGHAPTLSGSPELQERISATQQVLDDLYAEALAKRLAQEADDEEVILLSL